MGFLDRGALVRWRVELVGWLGILGVVGACGGAQPQSAAPPMEESAVDGTGDGESDGAQALDRDESADVAAFEKAAAELRAALPSGDAAGTPASPQPTPMTSEDDGEEISALQTRDRCQVACAALGSMKRSADRVCEMTGAGDSRCEQLRERVERARSTVYANCPSCAAARP